MSREEQKHIAAECREAFEREARGIGFSEDELRRDEEGCYEDWDIAAAWQMTEAALKVTRATPAQPDKAEMADDEIITEMALEYERATGGGRVTLAAMKAVLAVVRQLSTLPPQRDDSGRVEGLTEDLNQLIRVALTNPGDLRGFIEANYAKECRHYKGRPALEGKPLNLQTRDELLAHVRLLEAENERLTFEANAGRQAEAVADAEAKQMAEALEETKSDLFYQIEAKHGAKAAKDYPSIAAAEAVLARYKANQPRPSFQSRVAVWMDACFGPAISADKVERNHRFLEEALELVQAAGCSREDCLQLVDYVYGRPAGEPSQEVGGVMVTLAALCLANNLDMGGAAETELARVWTKIEQIRAKQAAKPRGSVLPVSPSYESKQRDASPAECSTCGGSAMVDLSGFGDYGICEDCPGAAQAKAGA